MRIKCLIYLLVACSCIVGKANAQDKYFTKSGKIEFVAIQDREVNGNSRSAIVMLDTKSGELQFSILVQSFEFKKALLQEKFNHSVLETDQFPKASFKGTLQNPSLINYQKDGDYPVQAKGQLTLHGITKDILAKGTLSVNKGIIALRSTFTIAINDYNISNPGIGDGSVSITVDCSLESMEANQ